MSITRPKRCLATSSAAVVSTEAKTLTSICLLQSMGSSSRRRVWPVGAVSKTMESHCACEAKSMNRSKAAISSVQGESSSSSMAWMACSGRPRRRASSRMRVL